MRRNRLLSRGALQRKPGFSLSVNTIAVVYHPVTLKKNTLQECALLFEGLASIPAPLVFLYPNADAGARRLIDRTHRFVSKRRNAQLLINLDHITYLSLLKQCAALIGNSSSGIIESAALGLPVVNVGLRQKGREHARNVLDVLASPVAIRKALLTATSSEFRKSIRGVKNLYGDGHASEAIANLLATVPLNERILFKRS